MTLDGWRSRYLIRGLQEADDMLRIDGAYLYELGAKTKPLLSLKEEDSKIVDIFFDVHFARDALMAFVRESVFSNSLRTIAAPAAYFFSEVGKAVPDIHEVDDWSKVVYAWEISGIKSSFRKFEAVLLAELQSSDLYHVSSKGGYDTRCLTDGGEQLFPSDLSVKVPAAVSDVKSAAKCIAFELPTAAAFHLHRANEAVLRVYFDEVAGEEKRPRSKNMGDFLKKMDELDVGDAQVKAVLRSLKDLHRNPVLHPEHDIVSTDAAISLCAAVRAAIGYMLDRIPTPQIPAISLVPMLADDTAE